jgi:hypothetical protein
MMQMQSALETLTALVCWAIKLQHWQRTHLLKDIMTPVAERQSFSFLECCVCFETKAPQRDPCVHCGGSLPVCEICLSAWSWAAGSVKRCVLCRSGDRRPLRERRLIDLHVHPMSPLSCLFTISTYFFMQYLWILCCYRVATSSSFLF